MSITPNGYAIQATMWADMAVSDVHRAARSLSAVATRIARDIARDETDFLMAAQEIESAWKCLTVDALINIGRARAALDSAREAATQIQNALDDAA